MGRASHRSLFLGYIVFIPALWSAHVYAAETACAHADIGAATAQARQALSGDEPAAQREALSCLLAATEAIDRKLDALIAGRTPFTGIITADGFYHSERGLARLRAGSGTTEGARQDGAQ